MLGRPVCGSRTWMWTTAAPARAAAMHSPAICAGVIGTCGLVAVVSPPPVTAQLMMVSSVTRDSSCRPFVHQGGRSLSLDRRTRRSRIGEVLAEILEASGIALVQLRAELV